MRRFWKIFRRTLGLLFLAGLVYLAIELPSLGRLSTQISAKWACQCHFIDGGDGAVCIAEDPVGFGPMEFSFDEGATRVDTDIWGLVSSSAQFRPEQGCVVE